METKILTKIFTDNGIQDLLPKIQQYVDDNSFKIDDEYYTIGDIIRFENIMVNNPNNITFSNKGNFMRSEDEKKYGKINSESLRLGIIRDIKPYRNVYYMITLDEIVSDFLFEYRILERRIIPVHKERGGHYIRIRKWHIA